MKHTAQITCPHCQADREVTFLTCDGMTDFYDEHEQQCGECGKWDDEPVAPDEGEALARKFAETAGKIQKGEAPCHA